MGKIRGANAGVEATIGYACDSRGSGLAYARVSGAKEELLRLAFRTAEPAPHSDRAAGYAALTAVARALLKRGTRRVCFVLGDARFVVEIAAGSDLPGTLVLPYVRLRCVLNSLEACDVQLGSTDELAQRARAEVALNLAA